MKKNSRTTLTGQLMACLRRLVQNGLDTHRQAEMNRLITRAGRRCTRDLRHATDHIEDAEIRKIFEERVKTWRATFWDTANYRDELHYQIESLELQNSRLEDQLKSLGHEPSIF